MNQNTIRRAEKLLGYSISNQAGSRTYIVIDGILYTDLFEGTPVIEGYDGTFTTRFNGSQSTTYKNEIILDTKKCKKEYEVTVSWGSDTFNTEINELLEWLNDSSFSDSMDEVGVKSKKIEDFSVSYRDAEEAQSSYFDAVRSAWSFYIRSIIIISVAAEQKNVYRDF